MASGGYRQQLFHTIHKHPTYCCAALHVEAPNRVPVVHGIEGRHLVDSHWRHLQYSRHLVHYTDAGKAVLPLTQVQQWHDCRLLVLARVPAKHLLDEILILLVELEGYGKVIVGCIAMLLLQYQHKPFGRLGTANIPR
jgi:hypothetical protein